MTEFITVENADDDWWICVCGNEPDGSGFWPCDANGNGVSIDIDGSWDGHSHVCVECGRIFTTPSMQVIGRNPDPIPFEAI
jgi:hypothetical protein